jgi:hypothetical protein
MILEENADVWGIRESALIPVVNKVQAILDDYGLEMENNETWEELKSLYLYGKGYHKALQSEKDALQRAYKVFAYRLSKEGRLAENLDLTRNAYF